MTAVQLQRCLDYKPHHIMEAAESGFLLDWRQAHDARSDGGKRERFIITVQLPARRNVYLGSFGQTQLTAAATKTAL